MSSHPFAELICAYLDGLPGAADVLNDALEEAGRDRVAIDGTAGERLALVLDELLTDPLARTVAVEFARHVVGYCDTPLAQSMLEQKASQLESTTSTEGADISLVEVEGDAEAGGYGLLTRMGWSHRNSPKASAAWALWGALQIPVRFVAAAAQRASTTELEWQVERLKSLLTKN